MPDLKNINSCSTEISSILGFNTCKINGRCPAKILNIKVKLLLIDCTQRNNASNTDLETLCGFFHLLKEAITFIEKIV